jgi:hypothetical protein
MLTVYMRQLLGINRINNQGENIYLRLLPAALFQGTLHDRIVEIRRLEELGPIMARSNRLNQYESEIAEMYVNCEHLLYNAMNLEFVNSRQLFVFLLVIIDMTINGRNEALNIDGYEHNAEAFFN